ncbi:septum site-determining protein MinC [Legionella israelensis]|uniref:Probable septum site-determining protein MinC n=1 Tax=Legionella israelensis TaxID=454 RepID=A0AAX1EHH2_9GAMM|nr:septum site-determining protein MinC [Legionella israelensis]QBR84264.1 septum site-determining protein MinC [Legionella israelensis]
MAANSLKSQAFKLKGRLYTFTVLQVIHPEIELFSKQLTEIIAKAPKLFENAPVVLDFSCINRFDFDLKNLCQVIREQGIIPVAIQGGNSFLDTVAQCQGLAVLKSSSTQDKPLDGQEQENALPDSVKAKIYSAPVRSGQQVVAKNSDLIVTSSVSHGAELLADGHIHVYGALRGRVLAGISGDSEARIFCMSLDAELISIAGFYRLSDAIDSQTGPCQIYLKDEHIHIEPL